jgi:hypothetical protein
VVQGRVQGMAGTEDGVEAEGPWLSLAEASERSGVHVDALRARLRRGRLEGRKGNAGQWLVRLPGTVAGGVQGVARGEAGALAELRDEVAELRVALARAEAEGAARAAKAEAEALAQRELVGELKRLLEAARRPWWRRLAG